jgi:murein DD-endopeptidase MepM/ murein hydrolase activator NlpD
MHHASRRDKSSRKLTFTQKTSSVAASLLTTAFAVTFAFAGVGGGAGPVAATTAEGTTNLTVDEYNKEHAQSYKVRVQAAPTELGRSSYSATTQAEVASVHDARVLKEANEAAAAAAIADKQAKASAVTSSSDTPPMRKLNVEGKAIVWPLDSYRSDPQENGFRTTARPSHEGFDMLAPAGSPIYASTAGTVIVSQESYGGYGVAVVIQAVIDGRNYKFTYGHMTYGTRTVAVGDQVEVGQMIGRVGSTGRSTANHLHFEVSENGNNIDPAQWLLTNAQ